METLRKPDHSVLVVTTEQNMSGITSTIEVTDNNKFVPSRTVEEVSFASSPSLDLSRVHPPVERFSPHYSDPQFPRKAIPYALAKRTFDLVFALTLLVLGSPVMLIAALLIKLTDRGPVFFKQVRVGAGGRCFWCYKFRSMCVDAEAKKQQLMHLNEASGPVFKIKRDPRITPIGAILRKYSIDELPQLINVVRGEMSVVGPRPPLPSEVAQYGERTRHRLGVPPGLTCLWQINGRSNVSFERWVELDLLYIETMSFSSDLMIVLKTVPAVLFGSGAH